MIPGGRRVSLIGPAILVIGALLVVPLGFMAYVSTLERGEDGIHNFRTDPISGDQRGRNPLRHRGTHE